MTATTTTPLDHLTAADALLGLTTTADAPGIHPRAAAFLLRRAVEDRIAGYIKHHCPHLAPCKARTKALWLAGHLHPEVAGRYASVWSTLSQACHFHTYALAPTLTELRSWRDDVAFVLDSIPLPDVPYHVSTSVPYMVS
ncbi:hypothetical protein [Kitasatospora sp. MAP5-34]|uniref:hypothetical protein n=1 Tax=Kitasatospora sp. MAP5-34 TaxID=3035102 RepID=UPI002474E8E6|nr:hypothetical protein [Kitasatospora sp. MAP5-34]MDH6578857.1 hypothetical protein [Kitasatospora sp. MAP5-34]